MRETQVWSLGQEDPLEKEMQSTPVFSPGKSHGQRILMGYSLWGLKESDTTEQLTLSLSPSIHPPMSKSIQTFLWKITSPSILCPCGLRLAWELFTPQPGLANQAYGDWLTQWDPGKLGHEIFLELCKDVLFSKVKLTSRVAHGNHSTTRRDPASEGRQHIYLRRSDMRINTTVPCAL